MKARISILLSLATLAILVNAFAADEINVFQLRIRFTKFIAPTRDEVPKEAQLPKEHDPNEHGAFKNLIAEHIASLTVTWADPQRFKTRRETESLIRDLLTSTNTQTWNYHVWSFGDGNPALVARVTYIDGTKGKWVIWGPKPALYWAYEDGKEKWWWGQWDALKGPYPNGMRPNNN